MNYPLKLDIEISRDDVISGSLDVLHSVKPEWDREKIKHEQFTAGISNRLFAFYLDKGGDTVLIRIYGENTDRFIDRIGENEYIRILYENGCAAQLYASFRNGISYGFIPGSTLNVNSVRDPEIYPLVCDEMAKIHTIDLGSESSACLWPRLGNLLNLIPRKFADTERDTQYKKNFPDVTELERRVDQLKSVLSKAPQPIALCHNDVLLENIVLSRDRKNVHFIDYEYAGPNPTAYDIANHFNEWAGVEAVDYSLLPTREERWDWVFHYLRSSKKYAKVKCLTVTDNEVDEMLDWVDKFSAASHLFWALWAIIQASQSSLDFDFLQYGIIRYREYERQLSMNFKL